MTNNFSCLTGTHNTANIARYSVSAHQPGEAIAFEIEFGKFGFAFTRKTLIANIFNDTDTMSGMINTITLINSDNILLILESYL